MNFRMTPVFSINVCGLSQTQKELDSIHCVRNKAKIQLTMIKATNSIELLETFYSLYNSSNSVWSFAKKKERLWMDFQLVSDFNKKVLKSIITHTFGYAPTITCAIENLRFKFGDPTGNIDFYKFGTQIVSTNTNGNTKCDKNLRTRL